MIEKELARITHDGIDYILLCDFNNTPLGIIPSPIILVTTKSSKKRREKKLPKWDAHFHRINVKNPIGLYKKIFIIFENFLRNYDYVHFTANEDDQEKREKIYQKALEKMGFKLIYVYINYREKDFLMGRKGAEIKKKKIKKFFDEMGG